MAQTIDPTYHALTASAAGEVPAYPVVVGIGCAALDYLGIVPAMPRFDDAEAARVEEWVISGGGPVATALATLAHLGVSAAYVGVMGDDMVGHEIRREFVRAGVDVRWLGHQPGIRSFTSLVLVEAGTGRRAFVTFFDQDAGFELTPEHCRLIENARFLHLDSWHPSAAIPAARLARAAGVPVCLDSYRVNENTAEWIAVTDILIATESFPRRYTGEADLQKASEQILLQGPRMVVTTLSEHGCCVATQDQCFWMPGFRVPVVDTTGAGDAFHGAFIYGLLQDWDLARTARFANAVGALACRRLGGRASLPTLAEAESLLAGRAGQQTEQSLIDTVSGP